MNHPDQINTVSPWQTRHTVLFPLQGKPKCIFKNDKESYDPHTLPTYIIVPTSLFGNYVQMNGGNGLIYYQCAQYILSPKKLVNQSPFDLAKLSMEPGDLI